MFGSLATLIPLSAAASRLDSAAWIPSDRATCAKTPCSTCTSRAHCLAEGLSVELLQTLDEQLVNARCRLESGERLYRVGDPFRAVFAIQAGCVKRTAFLGNGEERITGFYTAGAILGMDGISGNRHASNAVALGASDVCIISYAKLVELSQLVPGLEPSFHRGFSRQVLRDQAIIMLLAGSCAENLIAAFLLDLSAATRGDPSNEIRLPMTRIDIANFLGVRKETISRHLSRFKTQQLISIEGKRIRVLDRDGLRRKCSAFGR